MKLRKSKIPTNIRFDDKTNKDLLQCSRRFGLPVAHIIRRAVSEKLSDWEKNGIVIRGV